VASTGLIGQVSSIPLATSQLVPGLSFTLTNVEGSVPDGSYTFRIGMTVDDDDSDRRLEAVINAIRLDVAGGVITGVNPVGQTLDFIGRDTGGTLTIALNDPILNDDLAGPISVTAGNLVLDADALIDRLTSSSLALADVVNEFDDPGHFTYRVIVYQTGGSNTVQFGTGADTASFIAFPRMRTTCAADFQSTSAAVFNLNSSEFAPLFPLAYGVQGQYSVAGTAGTAGTAPGMFTETCTVDGPSPDPDPGPGPGDSVTPDVPIEEQITSIDDALDDITLPGTGGTVDAATSTAVNAALDSAVTLATDATTQSLLASTEFTNNAALGSLRAINDVLSVSSNAASKGGTIDSTKALNAVSSVASILSNLKDRQLTQDQKDDYAEAATDALANITGLINAATDKNNLANLVQTAASLLSSISSMNNDALDATLVTTIKGMSSAVMTSQYAKSPATSFLGAVDANDKEAVKAIVAAKPALAFLLGQSAVKKPSPPQFLRVLVSVELSASLSYSKTIKIYQAEGFRTGTEAHLRAGLYSQSGGVNLVERVELSRDGTTYFEVFDSPNALQFLSSDESTSANDSGTASSITSPHPDWYAQLSDKLYPDTMPNGTINMPNGSILYIEDGDGIGLAPQAYDADGLSALLIEAELSPSSSDDGSMEITIEAGVNFKAVFAYDDIGTPTEACGEISIALPTGDAADAAHSYEISCSNGVTQHLLPFLGDTALYENIINIGLDVSTDRNTGIITVEQVGQFKPSFFIFDLTFEEDVFLSQNGPEGFAFQARDENGDGNMDFVYLTENGSQILYGLQP
jgi:hypothetical protein